MRRGKKCRTLSFVKKVKVEHVPDWLNLALAVYSVRFAVGSDFTAETAVA